MTAEYILATDAPKYILISGEGDLEPFKNHLDGEIIEGFDAPFCRIPFTNENAVKLRTFLRGKDYEIPPRERTILKFLADHPDSVTNDKIRWATKLTDLRANKLNKKLAKIQTEWDLIHYFPLRYLDKSNPQKVTDLVLGQWAVVAGTVQEVETNYQHSFVKIVISDITGRRIAATFFRQIWLSKKYRQGDEVIIYGNYSEYINKKTNSRYPQILNPSIDKITTINPSGQGYGMLPIYPQKSENRSWQLKVAQEALLESIIWIDDPVPTRILEKYQLPSRAEAYRMIHFPEDKTEVEKARRRIAFDEFVRLQVYLQSQKEQREVRVASKKTNHEWADKFIASLPFTLTNAQQRVVQEIRQDLIAQSPMNRLLQGDVGSGKTEIASTAILSTVASGYQAAMLAPTDILATQLHERLDATFKKTGLNITVELFTGKVTGKKRTALLERLEAGEIDVIVGTHTLTKDYVKFKNLGLAVADESHKYGAEQRTALRKENSDGSLPDLLTMSATPIPRTTAQVIYGDMDISIVDELPANRLPIQTFWNQTPDEAWAKIREEIEQGHKAYVVAALVEDSENESMADIESATSTYLALQNQFPNFKVELLHGKMKKPEKSEVSERFLKGDSQILVATSLIEVGLNHPDATVMVVLNANRFGIASLHQIRGRVGRSDLQSYCYLVGEATMPEAEERLNALVSSNDGFWLAEKDLEIRGEGELFGRFQSGSSDLYLANLKEHKDLLEIAKRVGAQAGKNPVMQYEVSTLYKDKKILS